MGTKALRELYMGRETTAGTAVAGTMHWRGLGTLEDQSETVFTEEEVGFLAPLERTYIPKLQGALSMEEVEATFEQLPYILEAGVKGVNTGVVDTGGSGYWYTYPFDTKSHQGINTYTIIGGDESEVERMAYSFVSGFKISGKGGEALKMSAEWIGRSVNTAAAFPSPTLPTVEEAIFSKGRMFIDPTTTIGATAIDGALLAFSFNAKTGLHPVFAAANLTNPVFSHHAASPSEVTCDLTLLLTASAGVAEKAAWKAQTQRSIRLQFAGSALTTSGTVTTKIMRIDLNGKWEKFTKLDEQDGDDIVTGTFRCRYLRAPVSRYCTISVVNELATLP